MKTSGHATRRRALVAIAACVFVVAAVGGCRGRWRARAPEAPAGEVVGAPPVTAPLETARGPRGLEVQLWVVDDLGGQVAAVLAGLDEPALALDAGDARRWRDSGLRVVGLPAGQVDHVRSQLQLAAPVRREWLGQVLAWRPVALGPGLVGERLITADGPAPIDEGRLRLMARAWVRPRIVPGHEASAELRVELVPQFVEPRGAQTLSEIESRLRGELPTVREDGPVLERLGLAASLDGREALIIVGEAPNADWSEQARIGALALDPIDNGPTGPPVSGPSGDEGGVASAPDAGSDATPGSRVADPWEAVIGAVGPEAPEARTLGEAMLSGLLPTRIDDVGGGRVLRPRRRVLIVLVPHTQGAYTIATTPPGGGG